MCPFEGAGTISTVPSTNSREDFIAMKAFAGEPQGIADARNLATRYFSVVIRWT